MDLEIREKLSFSRTVNKENYRSMAHSEDHDVLLYVYSSELNTKENIEYSFLLNFINLVQLRMRLNLIIAQ